MKSLDDIVAYYTDVTMSRYSIAELGLKLPEGTAHARYRDEQGALASSLLYDTDRLTKAALLSFKACSWVRSGGYGTWGSISLYYARFFAITAMLRIRGIALDGQRLLLRTDDDVHEFRLVKKRLPAAKRFGCGGGSHREIWRIFSRQFKDWSSDEPPGALAALLTDDEGDAFGLPWHQFEVEERNDANYLRSNAGFFFPETDFSGDQESNIEIAKLLGDWDCLRTDSSPIDNSDPPEAWFYKEMMTWDLIKYLISVLVKLHGQPLLDQYVWFARKLEAHSDLSSRIEDEIRALPVK